MVHEARSLNYLTALQHIENSFVTHDFTQKKTQEKLLTYIQALSYINTDDAEYTEKFTTYEDTIQEYISKYQVIQTYIQTFDTLTEKQSYILHKALQEYQSKFTPQSVTFIAINEKIDVLAFHDKNIDEFQEKEEEESKQENNKLHHVKQRVIVAKPPVTQ